MTQAGGRLTSTLGLARSLLIYYGPLWRRGRISRFYQQFIAAGDLCFDVGAHVGNRVRAWRRLGARVVAIEPQPNCLRVLRYLYDHDPAVEIVAAAVGAAKGRTTLLASSTHPALSTTDERWVSEVTAGDRRFAPIRWDTQLNVDVTTLDDLTARYGRPTFCKIDVEGSELMVLRGFSGILPAVSFEFLPVSIDRAYACIDHLASRGAYRYRWSAAETMQWSCPTWLDGNGMKEILAAHPPEGCSGDVYAVLAD